MINIITDKNYPALRKQQRREYAYYMRFGDKWGRVKTRAKKRDNFTCVLCGSKSGITVHHLTYPKHISDTKENHLITVCRTCHDKIHKRIKLPLWIKKRLGWRVHVLIISILSKLRNWFWYIYCICKYQSFKRSNSENGGKAL